MFSFYGSKSKIIKKYPKPKFNKIIEPFAGSLQYSLLYWDHEIYAGDLDPTIVNIWKWLQQASEEEIINLPDMEVGMDLRTLELCKPAKDFMGFWANHGSATPKNIVQKWACKNGYWNRVKEKVSKNLYKIRHWTILNRSYNEWPNVEAVWFVDPPYAEGGKYYKFSNKNINYIDLAQWCRDRIGQVIVCENSNSNWLPFSPLCQVFGQRYKTTEVIWTNEDTNSL